MVGQIKDPAHVLRQEFQSLKSRLPGLWTRGKFIASVGAVSHSVVKQFADQESLQDSMVPMPSYDAPGGFESTDTEGLEGIEYYAISSLSGDRIQVTFKHSEGFPGGYQFYIDIEGSVIECAETAAGDRLLYCLGTDNVPSSYDRADVALYVQGFSAPVYEGVVTLPSVIPNQSSSDGGSDDRY